MASPEPAESQIDRRARRRSPSAPVTRASESAASSSRGSMLRDMDHASVLVAELLSGVLVWGGIGWLAGTHLGGHPWPFIAGSLLGFATGFYLLWLRAEGRIGRPRGAGPGGRGGGDAAGADADGDTGGS